MRLSLSRKLSPGIWRMRRYALTAAWIYIVYVMLNLTLFMMWNPLPLTRADTIFDAVYSICAIVLTLEAARRQGCYRLDVSSGQYLQFADHR